MITPLLQHTYKLGRADDRFLGHDAGSRRLPCVVVIRACRQNLPLAAYAFCKKHGYIVVIFLEAMGVQQSAAGLHGLWVVYALVPVIGMMISTVFYLFYKLNDKDVQIMAKCNSGQITREEAEKLLSRKY